MKTAEEQIEVALKKADENEDSYTVTISGRSDAVRHLLAFMKIIEYNGNVGHSATFAMGWDGDGADQVTISGLPEDIEKKLDKNTEVIVKKPVYEIEVVNLSSWPKEDKE